MGNQCTIARRLRLLGRESVQECRDSAPPQHIIMNPDAGDIMLAMSAGMHSPDTDRPVVAIGSTSVDGVRPVDTAIAVPRSSIALEQLDDSRFTVSFTYTAGSPATVSFLFQQKHQGLKNGVPSFSPPKLKLGPFDLPVGDKLKYRLDPAEARRHPQLTLDFCAFRSEHAFVPLLLLLESPANDYTLFVMAGLAFNDASGRWDLVVTKQRVRRGATGYELQEVYGLRSSALGRAGAPAGGDAQDAQDDRDCRCVVCLTDMKDTFLMPCRHMCLCFGCATTLSTQQQTCPMCRATISHIIHMSQMGPDAGQ